MSETRKHTALTVEKPLDAGAELDAAVAELMEPRPVAVSARELRARYRHDWRYSTCAFRSPGGWWWAEIGTDHGPPQRDDEPVTWRPARAPSEDIADAWDVVEWMAGRFHAVVKSPFMAGEPYHAGFTPLGCTGWNGRPDFAGSGETAPLAICRAALLALAALPSDQPPLPPAPVLPRSPDPEG
jgi:hypothetical protein